MVGVGVGPALWEVTQATFIARLTYASQAWRNATDVIEISKTPWSTKLACDSGAVNDGAGTLNMFKWGFHFLSFIYFVEI